MNLRLQHQAKGDERGVVPRRSILVSRQLSNTLCEGDVLIAFDIDFDGSMILDVPGCGSAVFSNDRPLPFVYAIIALETEEGLVTSAIAACATSGL